MSDYILKTALYLVMFGFALYGLRAIRFEKIVNVSRVTETWVLWLMSAMMIAYGATSFLLALVVHLQ